MGVATTAGIDPVSDALIALETSRPNAATTAFFEYDGRERLQATWDDLSSGSLAQPLTSYAYQDVTNTARVASTSSRSPMQLPGSRNTRSI